MKFLLAFIIFIHGLFHFVGFAHAYGYGNVTYLPAEIFPPMGISWLLAGTIFIIAALLVLLNKNYWGVMALAGVLLSEMLIISVWQQAYLGSLLNLLIVIPAFLNIGYYNFESSYLEDVRENLSRTAGMAEDMLNDEDIKHLPGPVQKYLRYVGVLYKAKVFNVRVVMKGRMRDKKRDWFPFSTIQYNFFDEPTRLFYIKAKIYGIMIPGYHRFIGPSASKNIKLFGLISVLKKTGELVDQSETVIMLNDMCVLAPATLICKNIKWNEINDREVEAKFSNQGVTVTAKLIFNEEGQLVNFISNDRAAIAEKKKYPFSTPLSEYQDLGGINLATHGEAIWHYPEGEFVYGELDLVKIEYNV
jgi:hypothetical protein